MVREAVWGCLDHPSWKQWVSLCGFFKVGEHVYKTAINHDKRAQCQGGAKNHVLIAEDAVIDEIMQNVVDSCFGHVGERCFAVSNVLAVEKIYNKVKENLLNSLRNWSWDMAWIKV